MAGVWRECVFRHAVCRVGVVISESRSWGIRTGRGITLGVPAGKEKNEHRDTIERPQLEQNPGSVWIQPSRDMASAGQH